MHAPRSAAALQTAALQQSATTTAPVTLKVTLWLKALHRSSHTALQPCSTAAQHPGKPAILQHDSRAAQEPSDFQLRRPCSIAATYSCLAAVLLCSNHRTRQRNMLDYRKQVYLFIDAAVQASIITLLIWARLLGIVFFLFESTGKGRRSDES